MTTARELKAKRPGAMTLAIAKDLIDKGDNVLTIKEIIDTTTYNGDPTVAFAFLETSKYVVSNPSREDQLDQLFPNLPVEGKRVTIMINEVKGRETIAFGGVE